MDSYVPSQSLPGNEAGVKHQEHGTTLDAFLRNRTTPNMEVVLFDHLETLDKSKTNWRIKVRVTRMWPTISSGSVKGYNFILLDDDNCHVHAYAYLNNWQSIGIDVVEGNVYIFENFQVMDTIGQLKPVSIKICICLLSSTSIQSVNNDVLIPLYKFEFMDLGDLQEECSRIPPKENHDYAIDVIGVIEKFENVKKNSYKDRRKGCS